MKQSDLHVAAPPKIILTSPHNRRTIDATPTHIPKFTKTPRSLHFPKGHKTSRSLDEQLGRAVGCHDKSSRSRSESKIKLQQEQEPVPKVSQHRNQVDHTDQIGRNQVNLPSQFQSKHTPKRKLSNCDRDDAQIRQTSHDEDFSEANGSIDFLQIETHILDSIQASQKEKSNLSVPHSSGDQAEDSESDDEEVGDWDISDREPSSDDLHIPLKHNPSKRQHAEDCEIQKISLLAGGIRTIKRVYMKTKDLIKRSAQSFQVSNDTTKFIFLKLLLFVFKLDKLVLEKRKNPSYEYEHYVLIVLSYCIIF